VIGRLVAATNGGVRIAGAHGSRDLVLTDATGCIGSTRLGGGVQEPRPVACPAFAAWMRSDPGSHLQVGAYVTGAGEVETLVEP